MNRSTRYRIAPPPGAETTAGELIVFLPEHDRAGHPPAPLVTLLDREGAPAVPAETDLVTGPHPPGQAATPVS